MPNWLSRIFSPVAKAAPASAPLMLPGSGVVNMPRTNPMVPVGVSGVQRTKGVGILYEEWMPQLAGQNGRRLYREMRDNDATLGAAMFGLEMLLRQTTWTVEAASAKSKAADQAEFVDQCLKDMSHPFGDAISEACSQFVYGFALLEPIYKRRTGPHVEEDKPSSAYDDGLIGWDAMEARAQETIQYWIWRDFDGETNTAGRGRLIGCEQLAAPDWRLQPIPMNRLLLFRTTSNKNNPEGRSVFRNCVKTYLYKREAQVLEQTGLRRDLAGYPVLYISAEAAAQMGGGDQDAGYEAARGFIKQLAVDESMGVVLPAAYDEKGNRQVELCLIKSAGRKQMDSRAIIKGYNEEMLDSLLMGFVQFGQTEHGARSLHMSATQIFANAIGAWAQAIEDELNRHAIPRLLAVNNMDLSLAPRIKAGRIDVRDLEEYGNFLNRMSQAGFTLWDEETENWAREKAGMPLKPKDSGGRAIIGGPEQDMAEKPAGEPGALQRKPKGSAAPQDNSEAADRIQSAV